MRKLGQQYSSLVGAATSAGPVRQVNQDVYLLPDPQASFSWGALYIVADGVGGQEYGAEAAQLAAQTVYDRFYQFRRQGQEIPTALEDALEEANQAIYALAQERGGRMGCTLVAAVQHRGELTIAHVGDARAYLVHKGRLQQLTRDDTWVQKQVDAGVITPEQAAQHELRNVVTQALGNRLTIDVNLSKPQPFPTGDILLLCSDGLYDVVPSRQLLQLLRGSRPPVAADNLISAAVAAGASDNITAVVVNSHQPAYEAASRRRLLQLPLWLALSVPLAFICLAAATLLALRPPGGSAGSPTRSNIQMPAVTSIPTTAATSTIRPTQSPLPAAATAVFAVESTAVLTPTSVLTPTAAATVAVTSATNLGCVTGDALLFVWRDDQIDSDTCDHFADFALEPGNRVEIVDSMPVSARGPDAACIVSEFIKVQSVATPDITGWVFASAVRPVAAGEPCEP